MGFFRLGKLNLHLILMNATLLLDTCAWLNATRLLAWSYKDLADQIIVATARLHGLKVLTSDSKILKYRQVASIASRQA